MTTQNGEVSGFATRPAEQGSSNSPEHQLSDRSLEKCATCRQKKKACRPRGRRWPEDGKCDGCKKANLECGPSTRIGLQDGSSDPYWMEDPETAPARAVTNAQWAQIKDDFERFYIEERKPLKDVMKLMQRNHGFRASRRQYHGQILKWGLTKYKKIPVSNTTSPSNTSSPSIGTAELARYSISSSVEPSNMFQVRSPDRLAAFTDSARNFIGSGMGIGRSPLQYAVTQGQPAQDAFVAVQPGIGNAMSYEQLENPRDIRLIRLLPGIVSDPISLEIYKIDLDRAEEFEAVSWNWESNKDTENVFIHDRLVPISRDLELAMHSFRDENMPRSLWIDAICINQADLAEKSRQVQLMAEIYSDANAVLVWLGPSTSKSPDAIKFIQNILGIHSFENVTNLPRALDLWEAFDEMLRLPWFRRVWALQELSVATACVLHWGDITISWQDFADAVEMVKSLEGSLELSPFVPPALKSHGEFFHQIQVSGVQQLLSTGRLMTFPNKSDHLAESKPSLETLLWFYRSVDCPDPRDRVYAVLFLSREWNSMDSQKRSPESALSIESPHFYTPGSTEIGLDFTLITVDYSHAVRKVLIEVIDLILRQSDSVDIICRPWAPELPGLPSWISTLGKDAFKVAENGRYIRVNADALVGEPGNVQKPYNACRKFQPQYQHYGKVFESGIFVVNGFTLCKVSHVASLANDGYVPADWRAVGNWNILDNLPPEAFWRTLVGNRDDSGRKPPPPWFSRACKWVFNQIVPGRHLNTNEILRTAKCPPYVAVFLRRVQSVVWKRRLFVTDQGYLGIGPEHTSVGDSVNILYGCSVPVILREIKGDVRNYNLIGDCYVHGMMDGEACRSDPEYLEYYMR